ncbi:DUF3263 domain-containing protein [Mycobacterium yunnanensis]|uniref:DUF3263 domain-containing protein n=1 Tax=Mycobacterium yunnanensis TaxID=368477 RepID=A0A9X2Z857_9MYCO|nr:DUF3263 domain-containing protein [Mycobacterium yunnanensis]MCV7424394.1 DUF3263 domain-containing protein [Mycobacterium yunnanensis]
MALDSLTHLDAAMLDLEHQWWPTAGQKENAIRDQLGMTPTRYYQRLTRLTDTEAALAHDPVLVNRLRRLRSRP